jgi:DNA-binding NtrC family response regulator
VITVSKWKDKFKILLCGKKKMMEEVRKIIVESNDVHLLYASSPNFLLGRAVFNLPDIVLIDVEADRLMLRSAVGEFCQHFPEVLVLALATSADYREAVELVKIGAEGYYLFPDDYRRLSERITMLLNEWRMRRRKEEFLDLQQRTYDFSQIIGNSPRLLEMLRRAKKIIDSNAITVLVTGETGTGKELIARAIHYNSSNRSSPFVDIGCSSLPENLLESELFGYEKGAFTDARERKIGLFELAADGTIFLDEIGDISHAMQSKLLKVIENRTMRRLGGLRDITVEARIIAATGVDLESKMKSGEFRKDLYHRLKILPLEIPPLRERKEDIPLLVKSFTQSFNTMYGKKVKGITPEGLQKLLDHKWEGNVRELKHSVERAVLLQDGEWLGGEDFEFLSTHEISAGKKGTAEKEKQPQIPQDDTLLLVVPIGSASLQEVQKTLALKVLDHVGGNKRHAAQILRISRPRLDRILNTGESVNRNTV